MSDEELSSVIQAVRDRARAAYPNTASGGSPNGTGVEGVSLPNLMPLAHARDAAEAKVAAIGTVNPRPPGLKNTVAQWFKRKISRALNWHVREQVEFNRAIMACTQATLEAMTDLSRAMAALSAHHRQSQTTLDAQSQELGDIRRHWTDWRAAFEQRRDTSEIHLLRTISELQGAFQHRVTLMDQSYRESIRGQHGQFTAQLGNTAAEIQSRLWQDLLKMRAELESLIYTELRVLRQKQAAMTPAPPAGTTALPAPSAAIPIDWMRFSDTFRGTEEEIRKRQERYAARFTAAAKNIGPYEILDVGCGRGEFLEAARQAGLKARGIDQSEECIAFCRTKGLSAEQADLFTYLAAAQDRSLGGIFCSQVVEHLPPDRVPALVQLLAAKLRPGALAVIETPNPECLAIFATHFYIDPTHTRPVPPVLLRFYLEEAGMGSIEVERIAPAAESIPALNDLPASVRDALFGSLDYAIIARKL